MIIEVIFLALLVLFALLGFWSLGRMLIARFALNACRVAVTLEDSDDIELLRLKIREVHSEFYCRRHRIVVLVPERRAGEFAIFEMLENIDVDYVFLMEN